MTDPTQRNTRPATDRPVMGDHPEMETDDVPQADPIDNDGGRSPLMIPGIVAIILVVIAIILILVMI